MKACLIPPIPDLERFVDDHATTHLLLSHLFGSYAYVSFYRERAERGDYLIVDNGAKENGTGSSLRATLEHAQWVHAKEVVLTDVRYKGPETIQSGKQELDWLLTPEGRRAYKAAGFPRLMIVPQGENINMWYYCLGRLLLYTSNVREQISEMPPPCIAFAYHYDHMFPTGLLGLFHITDFVRKAHSESPIHLLGWTRKLSTLNKIAEKYPEVRSVDSCKPFMYARAGSLCTNSFEYPGRADDFFDRSIAQKELAHVNVRTFREYAGDFRTT